MSRFDYVRYDDQALQEQTMLKEAFQDVEKLIDALPGSGARAKAVAYTKLEESYMWVGKAIRDGQIARNGSAPLQEDRDPDSPMPAPEPIQRDEEHA